MNITIYLYFPRLHPRTGFIRGQRGEVGGMDYCKGRFGECTYNYGKAMDGMLDHYDPTGDRIAAMLMKDVESAKSDLMRIQQIYMIMGWDDSLHNANYEIQFHYDEQKKMIVLYGYRCKLPDGRGKIYIEKTFKETCRKYVHDLETILKYDNIMTGR